MGKRNSTLDIELEFDHVAIGHHIVLALQAHFALGAGVGIEPAETRSSNQTISALMKPFWKSVWITPAASGAVAPFGIVQARDSLGPEVR